MCNKTIFVEKRKNTRIKNVDFRHKNRGNKSGFLSVDGGIKKAEKVWFYVGFPAVFKAFSDDDLRA